MKFMYDAETTEVVCNILFVENILQVRTFKKQIILIRTLLLINLTIVAMLMVILFSFTVSCKKDNITIQHAVIIRIFIEEI